MKHLLSVLVLSLALPAFAAPQQSKPFRIYWVDTEGGAATLVVTPEGGSLLMDCGWPGKRDAERIAAVAKEAGLSQIDHFINSHFHADHWGGVADLVERIPIAKFYHHAFPEKGRDVEAGLKEGFLKASAGKSVLVQAGDEVPLKGAKVRILTADSRVVGEPAGAPQARPCQANPEHPAKPEDSSDNARSVGILLTVGDFKFVDFGDLTWNVEHKLICPTNLVGTADVYQVSHHGLDVSNNPALLQAISPTVAVLNCGAKKGGKAPTFKWLKETSSIKDIFQLHRNITTTAADNTTSELTANDDEKCEGNGVVLTLEPGGKSYTVEIPAKKTKKTYAVK